MWKVLLVLIVLGVGAAVAWVNAGRTPGPAIEITGPDVIGQTGEISATVVAPRAALLRFDVTLTQEGATTPVFSLTPENGAELSVEGERASITRPMGKKTVPALKQGKAEITVTAVRSVLFGLREASSSATRSIDVRLSPPQIAVLSSFHYINHGGSEAVVYRVTPPDAESGVRVGDVRVPGLSRERRRNPERRPRPPRRVLRAALGPGPQNADHCLRARRDRQRRQRQLRLSRVPEAVSREPHRPR